MYLSLLEWISAILIGSIVGWMAAEVVNVRVNSVWVNMSLGVVGAMIMAPLYKLSGINFDGWIDEIVILSAGAFGCVLFGSYVRQRMAAGVGGLQTKDPSEAGKLR